MHLQVKKDSEALGYIVKGTVEFFTCWMSMSQARGGHRWCCLGAEGWTGCPHSASSLLFNGCTIVWFPKELSLYC